MLLSGEPLRKVLSSLFHADRAIAQETQAGGCRHCGGKLDVANFPRKPRGLPEACSAEWRLRFSFCCRVEGCRRRATPPSLRFLGRAVYLAWVVVTAGLWSSSEPAAARRAGERRGIDRRTWGRWQDLWLDFAASNAGREQHAQLLSGVVPATLSVCLRLWATLVRACPARSPPPWRLFLAHLLAPRSLAAFASADGALHRRPCPPATRSPDH